jgi:hypothetical protein
MSSHTADGAAPGPLPAVAALSPLQLARRVGEKVRA